MREFPFSIGKLILELVVIKFFMSLFRCCCSCCPPQKSRGKQAMHNLWEESCFCCSSQAAGDVSFISTGGTSSSSGGRRIKKRKRALFVLGETGILRYLRAKIWRSRMVHEIMDLENRIWNINKEWQSIWISKEIWITNYKCRSKSEIWIRIQELHLN